MISKICSAVSWFFNKLESRVKIVVFFFQYKHFNEQSYFSTKWICDDLKDYYSSQQ